MQCALLVKVGRYFQRCFGLHLAVHQFGNKARSKGREHQRGLVVWLVCHAAKIVKGDLSRVVKRLGIITPQITISITAFWCKMLGQPRPHSLTGLSASCGGLKGHGANCGKPAKAAAGVTTRQKFVAPVAFKCNAHGSLLPLRMQGAGQSGQQVGLGIG